MSHLNRKFAIYDHLVGNKLFDGLTCSMEGFTTFRLDLSHKTLVVS